MWNHWTRQLASDLNGIDQVMRLKIHGLARKTVIVFLLYLIKQTDPLHLSHWLQEIIATGGAKPEGKYKS